MSPAVPSAAGSRICRHGRGGEPSDGREHARLSEANQNGCDFAHLLESISKEERAMSTRPAPLA